MELCGPLVAISSAMLWSSNWPENHFLIELRYERRSPADRLFVLGQLSTTSCLPRPPSPETDILTTTLSSIELSRQENRAPPQFYAGPGLSGAPHHFHEAAWNALIYGRKRWFLFPPASAIYSTKPALLYLLEDYPLQVAQGRKPLECMQEAGDILVLPTGWGHAVLNVRESIGAAREFRGGAIVNGEFA